MTAMTESADQQRSPESPRRGGFTPRRASFWVVVLLPSIIVVTAMALRALPGPEWLAIPVRILSGIATFALVGIIAYPVGALAAAAATVICPRHLRASRLWLAAALALGLIILVPAPPRVRALRMWGVRHVPERAQPLLSALTRYHEDQGRYPAALSDLVPTYLPRIPYTGMMGYPDFDYKRPGEAREEAGGYDLYVSCGIGFANFDTFRYWPSQDYPDKMYGGDVERVDNWAYVHE
ncbi:MAG: hypothetical protein MUQ65_08555 [Armatimonadetes bacterium]|nr:hypothetical protein [Armatimonadota bacterium]